MTVAAHRRERLLTKSRENVNSGAASDTAGNSAKLREALEKVIEIADKEWDAHRETSAMWEMRDICTAALAAPPRNCDRFATLPDALAAWRDIDPREAGPFDLWLFDTTKQGGAK